MATYRLEAKIIGRSQGRSATASAAYRAAERIEDARTGQSFDYTNKRGVLHKEILAPNGTPDWMLDRAQLWNVVEKVEKRKDAQLARDLIISLPHELTDDQRRDVLRSFIQQEFVAHGMIADLAIHAPDRRGDDRNHHAHVMLTTRELTGGGFGGKAREWNRTELLEHWRERWAEHLNRALERHGHDARVDHRSLADQGIDREPEPKQGPVATKMERGGRLSNAGDDRRAAKARNDERAEIGAELEGIMAEIIDLAQERLERIAARDMLVDSERWDDDIDDMAEDDRPRRSNPDIAMTDGGLVAQQREAQRRFEENSRALQQRQTAMPEQDNLREEDRSSAEPDFSRSEPLRRLKAEMALNPGSGETAPAVEPQSPASPAGQPGEDERTQAFKEQMKQSFGEGRDQVPELSAEGEKDNDKEREISEREQQRRFKEEMSRSFTRDDTGDRSR